ncbi:hypothetical protein D770_23390 [Flammeovirgaceae bacterium 311]|nr:hypothetical protein D770_04240 [Flammeovirgaceae bacterium 311]AHM62923.1 hypothetical protein D770_23390 [Flammeovirgaceae bacterium 311]
MKSRITHTSYVIEFLDVGFSSENISQIIEYEVDNLLELHSYINRTDWELYFRATYTNARQLLISKNKFGANRSVKVKEVTVPIPIPLLEESEWGVTKEQHTFDKNHYDKISQNFWSIDVEFKDFTDRTGYILDCMRKAVKLSLATGLTVDGVTVKIK